MLPGLPGLPHRRQAPPIPPLPPGWTRTPPAALPKWKSDLYAELRGQLEPPAPWSGLPRPRQPGAPGFEQPPPGWRYEDAGPLRQPTSAPATTGLPSLPDFSTTTAPSGALARLLRGNAKPIATAVGMTLTVLTMIDGLGFVPTDAHEIVAVMFAALTPIAVALIPDYKPPQGGIHAK